MKEYENKLINGIYITRYIMSWVRSGGSLEQKYVYQFSNWLHTLVINDRKLTKDEIDDIMFIATNGKMELEDSAYDYLSR